MSNYLLRLYGIESFKIDGLLAGLRSAYPSADISIDRIPTTNAPVDGLPFIYSSCPACSAPSRVAPVHADRRDDVRECVACGGIFGVVERIKDYVLFPVNEASRLSAGKAVRYVDFIRRSDGERFHGWTDERWNVVQIG